MALEHLVQDTPEREDVRAVVRDLTLACSGAMYPGVPMTVCSCVPVASTCPGRLGGRRQLRETEVENLDAIAGAHKEVVGLQVAMDDALGMRGGQGVGDLDGEVERPVERQPAGVHARSVVPSSSSETRYGAFVPSHIEDRHDAGVVQCGGGPGFLLEPPEPILVGRKDLRQHLQRDDLRELRIPGAINAPMPPLRAAPGSRSGRSAPVPGQQSTLAWGDPRSSSGAIRPP